jgi:hypothetical protein
MPNGMNRDVFQSLTDAQQNLVLFDIMREVHEAAVLKNRELETRLVSILSKFDIKSDKHETDIGILQKAWDSILSHEARIAEMERGWQRLAFFGTGGGIVGGAIVMLIKIMFG